VAGEGDGGVGGDACSMAQLSVWTVGTSGSDWQLEDRSQGLKSL
jgi:hypothetical protein